MNTLELDIYGKRITAKFPADWDELEPDQFERIAQVRLDPDSSADFLGIQLLRELGSWNKKESAYALNALQKEQSLATAITELDPGLEPDNEESINDLYPLIDWCFDQPLFEKAQDIRFGELKGPQDELKNLCWLQFYLAETHFLQYLESKKVEDLDLLLACLYLTSGSSFDADTLEERAADLHKFAPARKNAALFNYMGLRNHVIGMYPDLYHTPGEESGNDSEEHSYEPMWGYDVAVNVPADLFGSLKERWTTPCHDILLYLNRVQQLKQEG